MNNMFSGCSELTSIIFANFDTSKVDTIEYMFNGCSSLTSLDLSSFDTKKVTSMEELFNDCTSLSFVNLSSFQTPVVVKLSYLFQNCKSLTSIYFPFLESSEYVEMDYAFKGCISLKFLDLSNFTYFQRCKYNNYMFQDCSSLQYINFGNIQMKCQYSNDAFKRTPENIIICSDDSKWNNIVKGSNISILCNNDGDLDYVINNKACYIKNSTVIINKQICMECGNNYYQLYNSSYKNDSKINCQKIPQGYYLDINEIYPILKQCFSSCETCEKGGEENFHNCIECKSDYKIREKYFGNYKNCYNNIIDTEIKNNTEMIKIPETVLTNKYYIKTNNKLF